MANECHNVDKKGEEYIPETLSINIFILDFHVI